MPNAQNISFIVTLSCSGRYPIYLYSVPSLFRGYFLRPANSLQASLSGEKCDIVKLVLNEGSVLL